MGKKFRFEKKFIDLGDIEGKNYKIEHNQEVFEKKDKVFHEMEIYQKDLAKIKTTESGLKKLDTFMRDSVDSFLGEGEYDSILKGRPFDIYERIDLTMYVLACIGSADEKRIQKVADLAAK